MKKQRRTFSGALKAKIAIEALKERETLAELARRYEVHPKKTGTGCSCSFLKTP